MSMISVHAGARRRHSLGLARILTIAIAHLRDRLRIRREMAALSDLSEHLLRNVGLEDHVDRRTRALPPHWR